METPADPGQRPIALSDEQQRLLHRAACDLVAAAVRQAPFRLDSSSWPELAALPVVGVFVTLRISGNLRGCIGNFAESIRLDDALTRAATGVARHDRRFPPLAPDELPQLTLDVSVLHSRQALEGSPRDRLAMVEIGRHGLDLQFEGRAGLLLPSVAVDHGWDAPRLLVEVCRKAGLPTDTWQDPQATLYRFCATCCGGPWTE